MKISKNTIKYIFIILSAIIGCYIAIRVTNNLDYNLPLFLNMVAIYFLYSISFILFFVSCLFTVRLFMRTKDKKHLLPLLLVFITAIYITIIHVKNTNLDKVAVIMCAKHREDIAGNIYIEFKKDNTYKLDIYSLLDGRRYRGKYHLTSDTIFLEFQKSLSREDEYFSNKLLMRNDSIFYKRDENNKFVENAFMKMEIIEQNKTFNLK